jgi:hypothetical protein
MFFMAILLAVQKLTTKVDQGRWVSVADLDRDDATDRNAVIAARVDLVGDTLDTG